MGDSTSTSNSLQNLMNEPYPYVVEIREPAMESVTRWRDYLSRVEQLPLQSHPYVQRVKERAQNKIAELTAK